MPYSVILHTKYKAAKPYNHTFKSILLALAYGSMSYEFVERHLEIICKDTKSLYAWLASAVLIVRNGTLRYAEQFCKYGLRYSFKFSEDS